MLPRFLQQNYPLERQFFLVPSISLRALGFYPEAEHQSVVVQLWAGFNFTLLLAASLVELWYGIRYLSIDPLEAFDALCPVATSIMSLIKISILQWHRREFAEILRFMRKRLAEQSPSPEKTNMQQKQFTLTTRLAALPLFMANVTAAMYAIRPLIGNAVRLFSGAEAERTFEYSIPYKMILPDCLLSMPVYPITYIALSWHGFITATAAMAVDSTIFYFCMYFGILLRCLQEDLKVILNENVGLSNFLEGNSATYVPEKVCQVKLCRIINRQNELYAITKDFSRISVVITFGHFVTSSMIICMCVIDVTLNSGFGIVLYIIHTCAVIPEIGLYCFGGQEVIDSSVAIGYTAYDSCWYAFDVELQKMLLLLIQRSQRPFRIRVPFFAPSIPVLASILRFAASLFTVIRTIL